MPTPASRSRTRPAWRFTRRSGCGASPSTSAWDGSTVHGMTWRGTPCAWRSRRTRRPSRSRSASCWKGLDSPLTGESMLSGMDGELLSIGRFARLSGLSVGALRHYHQHGLLVPASVDPVTGYRSYARAQADEARLIGSLRELGLALPRIRTALAADPAERRAMLAAHRTRLGALLARTQRQIHWLNRAIDHEEPIMIPSPAAPLDVDARRRLAA